MPGSSVASICWAYTLAYSMGMNFCTRLRMHLHSYLAVASMCACNAAILAAVAAVMTRVVVVVAFGWTGYGHCSCVRL